MEEVTAKVKARYILSPQHHELDKIFQCIRIKFRQEDWEEVGWLADQLHHAAHTVYQQQLRNRADGITSELHTDRSLVFYYAYSYLSKATVLQKQGRYDESRSYIAKYGEMGWFMGLDEDGLEEVERFRMIAKANMYVIDLLAGKIDMLPEYIRYLQDNPEELLPGIVTILEAANLHHLNVDTVLNDFAEEIQEFSSYEDVGNRLHYFTFLNQVAVYYFNHHHYKIALDYMLDSLATAVTMNKGIEFMKFVSLYEECRDYATAEQNSQYKIIVRSVLHNEKDIHLNNHGVSAS